MKLLIARFRRWVYLLRYGMARGECAISTYTADGRLVALWSGPCFEDENLRLWWMRE